MNRIEQLKQQAHAAGATASQGPKAGATAPQGGAQGVGASQATMTKASKPTVLQKIEAEFGKIEAEVKTFFAKLNHSRFVFASGKEIHFHNGKYDTSDAAEISELQAAVDTGHPVLYTADKVSNVPLNNAAMEQAKEIGKTEAEVAGQDKVVKNLGKTREMAGALDKTGASATSLAPDAELQTAAATAAINQAANVTPVNLADAANPNAAGISGA